MTRMCQKCGGMMEIVWNRLRCRPCYKAYRQAYYLANKPRFQARAKEQSVIEDPKQKRQRFARYRANNRDKLLRRSRSYALRRFFYTRAKGFNHRYGTSLTPLHLWSMWKRQRGRCALTGRPLDGRRFGTTAIDHAEPFGRGGPSIMSNLRWVCPEVNKAKGALTDRELFVLCEEILVQRRKGRQTLSDYVDGMQHLAGVML